MLQEYPDYYQHIAQPIAMSHLRKRAQSGFYKDLQQYREDWRLMFRNARTYNQEGSWVYVDAVEMEKVFDEVFNRLTRGTDLPGAEPLEPVSNGVPTPMDEDDKPVSSRRSGSRMNSKQVLSDDEYLTSEED